jgi:hypothetical protein
VLVGSLAATPDRWSDVDLEALVADAAPLAAVAAEAVERLRCALPVVHTFAVAFGDTLVRGLLLEDALEVDVAFTSASGFSVWGPGRAVLDRTGAVAAALAAPVQLHTELPDWSDEAGIAWHDVLHVRAAIDRGRPWQALSYLDRLRGRALSLAERRGAAAEELEPLRATLVAELEPEPLRRAARAATEALLAELRRGDAELAVRLERTLLPLFD